MAPGRIHPDEPAEGEREEGTAGATDGVTVEPRTDEEAGSASGSDDDARPADADTEPEPS